MIASRRQFLSSVIVAAAAPAHPPRLVTERSGAVPGGDLRAPDLSDDQVIRFVAGVRPFRRGGPRVEREHVAGKTVVHNYGGGSFEEGISDARTDPAICARILNDNRQFFRPA